MADSTVVLITLVGYKLVLLAIGFWASRRTASTTDFFLGGRNLGSWVAAISASASSSSAWTLLGVSGAAYMWGVSAIWLFPAVLSGFVVNWFWLAPRIRQQSLAQGAITVTDLLVVEPGKPLADTIKRSATIILVFCFTFYIAAQFKAAGSSFTSVFALNFAQSILLGAVIIMIYTLLGGFWAVSVTDTLQGLMMAGAAVILPAAAIIQLGGFEPLFSQFSTTPDGPAASSMTGSFAGISALGFVIGLFGIGAGYPGQPHVVNRFMALKDRQSLNQGRLIAIGWAVVVYAGMLLLGWAARSLVPQVSDGETVLFEVTQLVFSPVVAGLILAAVLSAVMSTADSQILVVASAIAHDHRNNHHSAKQAMLFSRLAVIAVCAAAVTLAIAVDDKIFNRVLFAWNAVGSAFGPILLVRLSGKQLTNQAVLAAMLAGFGLTVLINAQPNLPGDIAERWVPWLAAMAILLFSRAATKRN